MEKEVFGKLKDTKCITDCEKKIKIGSQKCIECVEYKDDSRKYNITEGLVTVICNYEKLES